VSSGNGNVTQMPGIGTMEYDGCNRMVSVNGVPVVGYDPDNRRVSDVPMLDFWLLNGENLMTLTIQDDPNQGAGAVQFAPNQKYFWFGGRMVGTKEGQGRVQGNGGLRASDKPLCDA
jgi:hypothetical protein